MSSRVALVFPYVRTRSATELLFPPLGIATLAGQLRRLGIETRLFDCTFGSLEGLRADLAAYDPQIVGISSMASLSRNTFAVAELVRATLPQSLLVAGGPLPTVYPKRFASHFDVVFRGEADLSFPRFCADYFARGASATTMGTLPLAAYQGLFVPNHGLHVDNPTTHHSEAELASFPAARSHRLRPRRLPGRLAARERQQGHLAHRHPGLPVRLRLLLEAGLRQRRTAARPRRGLRRDRRARGARLRRPLDRRRHLHPGPLLPGRVLPAHEPAAAWAGAACRAATGSTKPRWRAWPRPAAAASTWVSSRAARRPSPS